MSRKTKDKGPGLLKRSFAILGPGLITGAADDDPSGISTYSVAGAAYGYATREGAKSNKTLEDE
jgi:Mn2+/Fe2+ NRAMP family transporter